MTIREHRTFDVNLELHDGAAATTSSGAGQVDGGAAYIDLETGGVSGHKKPHVPVMRDAAAVFDISAIKVSAGDETYRLVVEGSDNTDFSTGDEEVLAEIEVGDAAAVEGDQDGIVGRRIVPITSLGKATNTPYRYVRARWVLGGTSPSITAVVFLAMNN